MMDLTEDNSSTEDNNEPHYLNNINASLHQMDVVNASSSTVVNVTQENASQTIEILSSDEEEMDIDQLLVYNPVIDLSSIKFVKRPKNVKKILPKHKKKTEKTINFLTGRRINDRVNTNIKLNGYELYMRDMETLLRPKSWLNDVIILNYISLLVSNCENTLIIFTDTLVDFGRRKQETVMKWTKKNNLYDLKRIVIPINPNKNHWALFVVDIWEGIVHSLDSFNKPNMKEYNIVSEFLTLAYNYSIKKPGEERTMPIWKHQIEISPEQKNTFDCGIFTCTNARYFLFARKREYTQSDCQLLRKRIAYELIHSELIEDQSTSL